MGAKEVIEDGMRTIDIVIPSFRADVQVLDTIRSMSIPDNVVRRLIIVLDDPKISIPTKLETWAEDPTVTIIRNEANLGAGVSRNRGIEESQAEWILFLDDDINPDPNLLEIYSNAITNCESECPGFVGVTRFPDPVNSFTRGIEASGFLFFFTLAEWEPIGRMPWGVTANLLVRRSSIGSTRFGSQFPKFGGGEDIDFCLQLVKKTETEFRTLPNAVVKHPWWMDGRRSYRRFFRWATGDSRLPKLHPEHSYRNLPNAVEMVFFLGLLSVVNIPLSIFPSWKLAVILCAIVVGSIIGEFLRNPNTQGKTRPLVLLESLAIRFSSDLGRIVYAILSFQPQLLTLRFDYAATGYWIKHERKTALVQLIVWLVLMVPVIMF